MKTREPDSNDNIPTITRANFVYQVIEESTDPNETIFSVGNIVYDIDNTLINIRDYKNILRTLGAEINRDNIYKYIINEKNGVHLIRENESKKENGYNAISIPDSKNRYIESKLREYNREKITEFLYSCGSDTTRKNVIILQDNSTVVVEADSLRTLRIYNTGLYDFTVANDSIFNIRLYFAEHDRYRGVDYVDIDPSSVADPSNIIMIMLSGENKDKWFHVVSMGSSGVKERGIMILKSLYASIKLCCLGLAKTGHIDIIKKHNLCGHITQMSGSYDVLDEIYSFWEGLQEDVLSMNPDSLLFSLNSDDVRGDHGGLINFDLMLWREMEAIGEHVFY